MVSPKLALVLGGGNALGAYHAGVYQALHEAGREPDWVIGASAGAITGALIAGNAPEHRIARLTEFWQPAPADRAAEWWPAMTETLRRTSAVMLAIGAGRAGMFGPIGPLGSWWDPDGAAAAPSLFDFKPLAATLAQMVDWQRLNAGSPRYTATAVDVETGDDVAFDTAMQTVTAEHIRGSSALLPTFPAVDIDGRAYADGGLSANLPLDPVLGERAEQPILCVAADLLPLAGRRPQTLGEAASRSQDLIFSAQSRRSIERWRNAYAHDPRLATAAVTLIRLCYADQEIEVAGKAMDFSPASVRHRWNAGHRDASAMLARLAGGDIPVGRSGLTVVAPDGSQ